MLSKAQKSTRSSTESVQTDSVRGGATSNLNRGISHQSSISEEVDNANNQSNSRRSSKSKSKSKSSSASSSPTESTVKPTTSGIKDRKTTNDKPSQRPGFRRLESDDQNNNSRKNPKTTSQPKSSTPPNYVRVSARDIEKEKPTSISGKKNQSIFEKVDTHNGHTSYLGTGSFTQLEACIQCCLSHNKYHTDSIHRTTKYDHSHKSLTRASVLEDYSYEGITSPKHHHHYSDDHHHYSNDHHHYSNDHHHPYSDYHHHSDNHKRSAALLSLNEIRQVNDALAKYGIPVFSGHDHHYDMYNKPRPVGDIISACQLILQDPTLASLRTGPPAVQHVWDALQHSQPNQQNHAVQHVWDALQHNQPNQQNHAVQHVWDAVQHHSPPHGYASPAMRGVASHLFNTSQPPYHPVNNVASNLFSGPQQQHYTASPFSNTFHQYPGNNNYGR